MSTPSSRRSRRSAKPARPLDSAKPTFNVSEFAQLCLFLKDRQGFAIGVARYNIPAVREAVIEGATHDLAEQGVTVTRLDLTNTPQERSLLVRLKEHCDASTVPQGHTRAVLVTGVEAALEYHSFPADDVKGAGDGLALFTNANVQRDRFAELLDVPVVFWLSHMAETAFARAAPDLWNWRKAFFDFSLPPELRVEFERRQLAMPLAESGSLDVRTGRERIIVLKDALARERCSPGADRPASKARRARLCNEIGLAHVGLGELDPAIDYLDQARSAWSELDDRVGEATASGNLGVIYRTRGDLDEAERWLRKALEIDDKLGRLEGMANQYANLGNVMFTRGDLDEAERWHRKALEIEVKLGRLEGMAGAYGNLGLIYRRRGDLDEAERLHRQSLEIFEKLGRLEDMASEYGNLGLIYKTRGDLDEAERLYRKALEIDEKLGRLEGMANQYGNLGVIYQMRGDLDEAERLYRKALEINEKLGRLEGMASDYGNLGAIYRRRGDLDEAERLHRKGLEIDEKLGRLEGMASKYGNLGLIQEERGDFAGARELWTKARDLYARIGMPHMVAKHQGWIDGLPTPADPRNEGRPLP